MALPANHATGQTITAADVNAIETAVNALSGTYVQVVAHGATASTARPPGAVRVLWRGTVSPTNIAVGDIYEDITTPSAPSQKICTTVGPVVLASLGGGGGSLPALIRAVAASYAATVTPNADTTDVLNVGTLTGNLTLANPTGTPVDGQVLKVRLVQDATGSRTITFGAGYAFGTDITAALIPTIAGATFEMIFQWNATVSKWRAVGLVRGF